ncbi:hypothetical protein PoB_006106400 [Plakobranchus ocellatus]|uniref:Uncharacterized protein n=1 Tax=Plakobranchus ocellatus TaxID=259542 RepID=A0AAV4CRT7_9GAST|nr:hypothetical protein PoB_006106400 [Plakobranchus ocellatus]
MKTSISFFPTDSRSCGTAPRVRAKLCGRGGYGEQSGYPQCFICAWLCHCTVLAWLRHEDEEEEVKEDEREDDYGDENAKETTRGGKWRK